MEGNTSLIIYMIASFVFAFVIILKKDTIPEKLRRPLAILALFLVASAFIFFLAAIYTS